MKSLKYIKEALDDVKVLEEYYDPILHADTSDPNLSDYFTTLYKLKFSLALEGSNAVGEKLMEHRKQYEVLQKSKDYKAIQELIESLIQGGLRQKQLFDKSDKGKSFFQNSFPSHCHDLVLQKYNYVY